MNTMLQIYRRLVKQRPASTVANYCWVHRAVWIGALSAAMLMQLWSISLPFGCAQGHCKTTPHLSSARVPAATPAYLSWAQASSCPTSQGSAQPFPFRLSSTATATAPFPFLAAAPFCVASSFATATGSATLSSDSVWLLPLPLWLSANSASTTTPFEAPFEALFEAPL